MWGRGRSAAWLREPLVGEKGRVERLRHHTARDVLLFPGSRHLLLVGRAASCDISHRVPAAESRPRGLGGGGSNLTGNSFLLFYVFRQRRLETEMCLNSLLRCRSVHSGGKGKAVWYSSNPISPSHPPHQRAEIKFRTRDALWGKVLRVLQEQTFFVRSILIFIF